MEHPSKARTYGSLQFERIGDSLLKLFNHELSPQTGKDSVRLALFDLDDTLIATRSGRFYPYDPDDWAFKYPTVP